MVAKSSPPVARGQRVWNEVVFEPDPEMVARVRHVKRPKAPLKADMRRADHPVAPEVDAVTDVAATEESPSVWEAREED